MVDVETQEDEEKRTATAATGAVAIADETEDELPALLAIAVGVAILAIAIVWPSITSGDESADSDESAAPTTQTATTEPAEAPATTAAAAEPVAEETDLTAAGVNINAAQSSITLVGTVPDAATEQALVAKATEIYSAEAVVNELVVDEEVDLPVQLTLNGELTDPVLFAQLAEGFGTLNLENSEFENSLVQTESGELETSLNRLEAIQFATGSAQINPESATILDEAAAFFKAEPETAAQIGGHTDSTGDPQANQALSQSRAEAVKAALEERGVTNELRPRGFGATRLKVVPEDSEDARSQNRRIEFRVVATS